MRAATDGFRIAPATDAAKPEAGDAGSQSDRAAARLARVRAVAVAVAPASIALTTDHPLARAVGVEKAELLLSGDANAQQRLARQRRDAIDQLSRAGRLVREIAAELKLSYAHVVAIRRQLGVGRRR